MTGTPVPCGIDVVSLTLTAARDLGRFGIRLNAIAPGFMDTDMFAGLPSEWAQRRHDTKVVNLSDIREHIVIKRPASTSLAEAALGRDCQSGSSCSRR
nr:MULTISPECIES: SDR family oxidoreductase [unclassified Chelatococcus]